jgi:hypothetical protein
VPIRLRAPKMDREERIRRRAYDIWCAEGWPKGREREHWEQACREIEEADASADAAIAESSTVAEANRIRLH